MTSPRPARIGIVEDDAVMGGSLVQRLELEGYRPVWWQTAGEALAELPAKQPDLLICDIRLPDMDGEEVFRQALPSLGAAPVLFITAYGDIEQAVRLVRAGADDYLTKPFDIEGLLERMARLLQKAHPRCDEAAALGVSPAMRRIEALLRRVADIGSTVLLTGESGVGKEVAARFLHQLSARNDQPFMAVNCAAIPAELLESELFGHERGAFTGAQAQHRGYAERARKGVLFLDEVGDLAPALQVKLLRLLHDRSFFRLGGDSAIHFAARVICATNRDLDDMMTSGAFREDLFYRINVIPVRIPPLRERTEDILPLVEVYVRQFNDNFGRSVRGLTEAAKAELVAHPWPGNVRELRNRTERAVALAEQCWLGPRELFPDRFADIERADIPPSIGTLAEARADAERRQIQSALEQTDGHLANAANVLGISRTTLWEKMRKFELG
ncbi:MAG: sigma-54-dependent Fis family transcriptional regulator [Rhizobiales bacterium]|nr:sigma-54-dependent Fis family transcriptional regulator [Hyphomicrobiales bacterium]